MNGRSRWRTLGLAVALLLLVLGTAYGAVAWYLGDQVPAGTTVAGVPVGGLDEAAAQDRLADELSGPADGPVPVRMADGEATIDPGEVGLAPDVAATLDNLTGFTLDPRVLSDRVFGGGPQPLVSTVDEDALRSVLTGVAASLDVPPVEGQITFTGATPETTEPEDGAELDVDAAAEQIPAEWLTAERPLDLPSEPVPPTVDADAVEEALDELAEPLVSAPVAVSVDDHLVELTQEDLADAAQFVAEDDALALRLDGEQLRTVITEREPDIRADGQDARFSLQEGAPVIIPSTAGRGIAADELAEAVRTAGTSTSDRTATVELTATEPDFTTADAEALGIEEIVAEFSTPIPYDPVRTENLRVGSEYVTGTVVLPGENFSLLDTLGPITEERGYVSSGVVEDGFLTTALGGGLSQLSTNMYNVGFLAGMDDVEHTPHSRWFDRYPAGREATIWEPTVDMVWHNNTDYGVFAHSWVEGSRLHTRLWGTDVWDVESFTSEHYNITQPRTVYNTDPECEPEPGGQYGFTVDVTRERYREGAFVDEQHWRWTYQPWNRVVCGSPPG
ncbi:VanW family protein [Georgenia sp. 10Sc9-8]|uniref:VanW family protein n=1 Tax=Georgenia halotolerans TaxID=3028317 RepID=A0ABT5U033_9MICO|nr:VanW family protein [Georgenia halotolerans]